MIRTLGECSESIILFSLSFIAIIFVPRLIFTLSILPFHKTGPHHFRPLRRRHLIRFCLYTLLSLLFLLLFFFLLRVITTTRRLLTTVVSIILYTGLRGRAVVGNLLSNFS